MKATGSRSPLALAAVVASLAGSVPLGCSQLVARSNAGIPALEAAPCPAGEISRGAKYAGWILAAPLVGAVLPLGLAAWCTPWVDLAGAADIVSAPAIGMGFALEAVVGCPAMALRRLAGDPRPPAATDGDGNVPLAPCIPWGFVAGHRPCAADPRSPDPLPEEVERYYAVSGADVSRLAEVVAAEEAKRPGTRRIRLSVDLGVPSALDIYLAPEERAGPRPLVLMTPPLEAAFAARYLGRRFARRGVHAAVIVPEKEFLEPSLDARALEAKFRGAVVTARTVLRTLSARGDVDRGRLRYLGVSAGGIFGSVLLAVEPAIGRAALVMPGGDLPRILSESGERSIRKYRAAWAERGVGPEMLAAALRRELRTDPLLLAGHVDARRVLIFLGSADTIVPTDTGLALRRALGGPETYVLSGGHIASCLCFGFILDRADAFLLEG